MKDKEYEMPDDYKQAVNDLLEFIKQRDELIEIIKLAPPERVREGQELLVLMNEKIEECEAALASEYEAHQVHMKALDEYEKVMTEAVKRMQMMYVYVKHRLPETLPEMEATIFNGLSEEEIQEFMDGVAVLEATRLEELIAEAKDNQ